MHKQINNEIYDLEGNRWWDADFSLNLIRTFFNPIRVGYAREISGKYFSNTELHTALEVGCGGGILAEEIVRLGFKTFGIDPSQPSLEAARNHASKSSLSITYIEAAGEALPFDADSFDIVFCCDVLEHVQDLPEVISEISRVLKPGGIFIYDTFNRTLLSKLVAIKILQEWKRWALMPPQLHVWNMFIKPKEMKALLKANKLKWIEHFGILPDRSVLKIWHYLHLRAAGILTYEQFGSTFQMASSRFTNVMYMGYAIKDSANKQPTE